MINTADCEMAKLYIETIINSISAGIMTSDLQGNILSANKYFTYLFGYTEEEIEQKKAYELFEGWDSVLKALNSKTSYYEEDVYVNSNKNVLQYSLSVYPIFDTDEDLNGIVYVFKEIKKVRKTANKIMGRQAIYTFDKIIGENRDFVKIIEFAKQISDSRSTILILGESGTGKEVFAQSIHNHGNRRDEAFVALNCGAIPKNLIESELFGYEEGAFTGAKKSGHPGKFEVADGGTIFLDEIGEMPLDMQTRLLRVIEEGVVSRIGSTKEIVVDVRIISASNKNLVEEVNKESFRKDLFYRLNVLPLYLPPLRERRDDIPLLLDYFMERISKRINKKKMELPEEYLEELISYNWPGNIRELENLVELMLNTGKLYNLNIKGKTTKNIRNNRIIGKEDFRLVNMEREHIKKTLKYFNGNITNTAKALGIGRNTLYRKIKSFK